MRRLIFALIAVVSTFALTSIASAADMPVKGPAFAPPMAPYSWQGFYVGGHIGYGWGNDPINFTPSPGFAAGFAAGSFPGSLAGDPRGVLGGIQYGTNWQFNRIVLGWESDFSFTDIKNSQTIVTPGPFTNTAEQKLTYFSTSRVRAGYAIMDNLLLYGTGGLAAGRASANSSFALAGCVGVGTCASGNDAKTLWGWTAGAGLEYGIGHWSVKAEYLHYDLGHLNYDMTGPTVPGGAIAASAKFSGDLVRAGLNYRFDWTPWELLFGRR